MSENENNSIDLAEFIQQVREDLLLETPQKDNDAPFLFVESVELELQVTAKRTEKAGVKSGVKISVLGVGGEIGGEIGGDVGREQVQKIKVKLSPIFDKERLLRLYEILDSDKVPATVKNSLTGLLKGNEVSNLDEELGG